MPASQILPNPENIPTELQALPNWVCYILERTPEGRLNKKPRIPFQLRKGASSTDPSTWSTFEGAMEAARRAPNTVSGIGVMVNGSGLTFIDIDHCVENGVIVPWALDVVRMFDTYTEFSPSGTGLHLFIHAEQLTPGSKCRTGNHPQFPGVEIYQRDRYFTVTGNRVDGTPLAIRSCDSEFAKWYGELFGVLPVPVDSQTAPNTVTQPATGYDPELIALYLEYSKEPMLIDAGNGVQMTVKRYEYEWVLRSIQQWVTTFELVIPTPTAHTLITQGPSARMKQHGNNMWAEEMNAKKLKYTDLLNGKWHAYFASQSEADQSLCNFFAYFSCCDVDIMTSLFRESGLYRPEKWERNTYRNPTIAKAIQAVQAYEQRKAALNVFVVEQLKGMAQTEVVQ